MYQQIVLVYLCSLISHISSQVKLDAIRWADHLDSDARDLDLFFDRIVFFVHQGATKDSYIEDYTVLAPGVLITNELVLTSYNAFRSLMADAKEKQRTIVAVLENRYIANWTNVRYDLRYYKISCARPLMPMDYAELWVGRTRAHSPVHDLMVARISESVLALEDSRIVHSLDSYDRWGTYSKKAGPILTAVAEKNDEIGNEVKFASIGFINDLHIWRSCYLRSRSYTIEDDVVEDCDEWIPREWGHFICIKNTGGFEGVGSGAMLVYNNTLFGVGSFFLKKGYDSVLIFTDVRPYRHIMFKTCTKHDQQVPLLFYTTTTTSTTTRPRSNWLVPIYPRP